MAGAWSADSCEGCSSTSCTCGHKGKWGDSSLLGKRLSEDSSRHQLLQKWASMWSSVSGDASVAPERTRREEAAEPAEEDRPLVFLCSRCRRPLGDSLSWVASQEDTNSILLRCQSGLGRVGWDLGLRVAFFPGVLTWAAPEEAGVFWRDSGSLKAEKSERLSCSRKGAGGESSLNLGLTRWSPFLGSPIPEDQGMNQQRREHDLGGKKKVSRPGCKHLRCSYCVIPHRN